MVQQYRYIVFLMYIFTNPSSLSQSQKQSRGKPRGIIPKRLNEAMDKVRRVERIEHEELKGHKYTFLRNRQNLSDKQEKLLSEMIELYPNLGKAYRLKVLFNDYGKCLTRRRQPRF